MKKALLALMLAACFVIPALAQESNTDASKPIWDHGDNVSNITYRTVQVYKVYDQIAAYIVLYQMQGSKIGQAVIPKAWGKIGTQKKLWFRNKAKKLTSSMTVFYKDDQFLKVVLTVSPKRNDAVWQIAPAGTTVNADVETLDIVY